MPKKRSKAPDRVTPGPNIQTLTKRQGDLPKRYVGGTKGGGETDVSAIGLYSANILDKTFDPIPQHDIEHREGVDPEDMADSLKFVYSALKKLPGFKDNKKWDGMPTIGALTDYLYSELATHTPKGYNWVLIQRHSGWKTREHWEYYYWKNVGNDAYRQCPLEWIIDLYKTNTEIAELATLIIGHIALSARLTIVTDSYNDFVIEDIEGYFNGDDDPDGDIAVASHVSKYWPSGEAYEFFEHLKYLCSKYSKRDTINKFWVTRFKTQGMERDLYEWLKKGCDLLAIKNLPSISSFNFPFAVDESGEEGDAVAIDDYVGFVWSFHDRMYGISESYRNDIYSNYGAMEPCVYGSVINDKHEAPNDSTHLGTLLHFMETGRNFYFKHFDKALKNEYNK